MVFTKYIRFVYFTFGLILPSLVALTFLQLPLNAQPEENVELEKSSPIPVTPTLPTKTEVELEKTSPMPVIPIAPTQPENARPLDPQNSLLSLQGGQRLMKEADNAIASENYDLANQKLQEARQIFNQLSNFHSQLAASFSGIDNRLADSQRTKALETAQMRDQATYQLALVHRAQNQPDSRTKIEKPIVYSRFNPSTLG